ncbi:MAG: dihydroorotate dehydrogenase [Porticoccaceae bacterium]|jgi:dihydroorotate dehydrogenase
MPDWSYQTVFRPILIRMQFETARDLSLGSMGGLARLPGGGLVISLLGHMRPDGQLRCNVAGLAVSSPVGLGAGIDTRNVAIGALAKFGFGLLEVGPLDLTSADSSQKITLDVQSETLTRSGTSQGCRATELKNAVRRAATSQPVLLQVILPARQDESTRTELASFLSDSANLFDGLTVCVPMEEESDPTVMVRAAHAWLLGIREAGFVGPVFHVCNSRAMALAASIHDETRNTDEFSGLVISSAARDKDGHCVTGGGCFAGVLETVVAVRNSGRGLPILATGGVHDPGQAKQLFDAGADVVLIDSGLVFAGPGLPKRINEVLLHDLGQTKSPNASSTSYQISQERSGDAEQSVRGVKPSWFWTLLLAVAMFGGGTLAMSIATTRVVLPYDEAFIGMTRDERCGINDRLLPFLTHDRVTLAGTMLADGILYLALSLFGIRAGFQWARSTILISSMVGFFNFFLFLGFGYFDPFHAFVTAVLFQFILLAIHSNERLTMRIAVPDLANDRAWRLGLWGQLIYVVHGVAILVGGLVICSFGVTTVFVQDDLDFMRTSVEALATTSPRLIPLIAHDRASFGGMLISCGACVLLCALWGFRRGAAWLWWALLIAGLLAYGSTIAVHHAVGYTSLKHLLPAYGGLLALLLGSALSAPWMLERPVTCESTDRPR